MISRSYDSIMVRRLAPSVGISAVFVSSLVCSDGGSVYPWMTSSEDVNTARSMQFSSSRTFPGQW